MASSGNFPTLNSLYRGQRGTSSNYYPIITQGNTRAHSSSNSDALQISTVENLKTGKWYWEWCLQDNQGDKLMHSGAADSRRDQWDYAAAAATYGAEQSIHFHTYFQIVEKNGSDTGAYSSSASSHSVDDVFGIALDTDNGKFYVHKNGTYYASGNPATGANPGATWTPATEYTDGFTPYFTASGGGDADGILNFGQDSTFGGAISAGGNADGNGFGDFKYAPPTGFLAVCSANLPISDDIDPAQTDDDFPGKQFNVVTYTGIGGTSANNVTGVGFQPDLIWIKNREQNASYTNTLVDSSRGRSKVLYSQRTDTEATSAVNRDISSIDSDGFTIQDTSNIDGNQSGIGYVAWCWKANGGTTVSNSDGSITTTLQVGKGFSIGTYTGTSSNATVGHGLGAVPDFTIFKRRDYSGNWAVTSQKNMASNDHNLYLQLDNAQSDGNYFQNTAMTSSVISIGTHADINEASATYVMYNWINVEGYQKFGKYNGNGNADGPFIYTGFRPRMFFVKLLDSAGDWWIQDTARSTFNPASKYMAWNRTDAEATGIDVDFLSNGFKIRTSSGDFNSNGAEILYGAWGDVPFKYNNTF